MKKWKNKFQELIKGKPSVIKLAAWCTMYPNPDRVAFAASLEYHPERSMFADVYREHEGHYDTHLVLHLFYNELKYMYMQRYGHGRTTEIKLSSKAIVYGILLGDKEAQCDAIDAYIKLSDSIKINLN